MVPSTVKIEFYRGIKAIAAFVGVHPDTARDALKDGRLPGKKDGMGVWVLCNLDYYQSLTLKWLRRLRAPPLPKGQAE